MILYNKTMKKYKQSPAIEKQLTRISGEIQKKYFPELTLLPVKMNTRMKCLARIFIPGVYSNPKIEVNLNYYHRSTLSEIKETFKHEYIHYQLHHQGKSYGHNLKFAKISCKMGLNEHYYHMTKYIGTCSCGFKHGDNKRKNINEKCLHCGKKIKIRKRF